MFPVGLLVSHSLSSSADVGGGGFEHQRSVYSHLSERCSNDRYDTLSHCFIATLIIDKLFY